MFTGKVQVYYGEGRGKTSAALGCAIHEASQEGSVIVIQFLKKKDAAEYLYIERLEPEIRMFRFQKSKRYYDELNETEQFEEQMNMKNGLNYARKVLLTGECSTLILDEVLGLVDKGIISVDELKKLIRAKQEETDLILTGRVLPEELLECVDEAYEICIKKQS